MQSSPLTLAASSLNFGPERIKFVSSAQLELFEVFMYSLWPQDSRGLILWWPRLKGIKAIRSMTQRASEAYFSMVNYNIHSTNYTVISSTRFDSTVHASGTQGKDTKAKNLKGLLKSTKMTVMVQVQEAKEVLQSCQSESTSLLTTNFKTSIFQVHPHH